MNFDESKRAQTKVSRLTPYQRDLLPSRRPPFFDRLDKLDDVVQQRILDEKRGKVTKE
jgi:hypothetical protein